jgi:hypothetical protein
LPDTFILAGSGCAEVRLAVVGGWFTGAMRSSHIIYVDESGSPAIGVNLASYPVFVLAFCIFKIENYVNKVEPAIQALKFAFFGHDLVIFHESEIRKRVGSFRALNDHNFRESFLEALGDAISNAEFKILPVIRSKVEQRPERNLYLDAALEGINRSAKWLISQGFEEDELVFAFESRGTSEDSDLARELALNLANQKGPRVVVKFIPKSFASTGLQIADLVARPIGLSVIRPGQHNRSFETIAHKIIT